MEISYLDCDGKYNLFSFYRHDYNSIIIDEKFYMIDGGQEDYCRYSGGISKKGEIKDLISSIRIEFTIWTKSKRVIILQYASIKQINDYKKILVEKEKSSTLALYLEILNEELKLRTIEKSNKKKSCKK